MLMLLTCACGNASPLAYQTLQAAGIANWATVPIEKGKEHVLNYLANFPMKYQTLQAFQELIECVKERSTFVVVVGYDEERFYWANIKSSSPKDTCEAMAIAKEFNNI